MKLLAVVFIVSSPVLAQEVEDTIRTKTRVVFLDALVKDKKTNLPISNLSSENFEVADNGKSRQISYFSREGQARKPLALILILDVRAGGAGRFLKKAEVLKSMEVELAKLPPGDEVAIMAMDIGEDEKRLWLTEFTNDRIKLAAALARVPRFVEEDANPGDSATAMSIPGDNSPRDTVVHTEVLTGKNGSTLTRTIKGDGSVDLKRVNKNGDVTVEIDDVYDMAAAVKDATRSAQRLRPNSQIAVLWVSDGIAPIFFEDIQATEQLLIRENVIFNSLTADLRTLLKLLMPVVKPVVGRAGLSLYGSAKQLAHNSGGEALKASRVKDYGAALNTIIGSLAARYSLGFALAEDEIDDGRMHKLEVRVKATDEKGKNRKLVINSRQGYYMSTSTPKEAAKVQ